MGIQQYLKSHQTKLITTPVILLTANLFFTGSFSLTKFLSQTTAIETIMLFRFLAGPVYLIPYFLVTKKKIVVASYKLFVFRILCGVSAMSCLFLAFKFGQIGKSMLIFELSTIWTLLIGYIVYNNKPHSWSLAAVPLAFIGIYMVIQPTNLTTFQLGDGFAFLGSLFSVGVYISLKKLHYQHDTTTIVLITYSMSACIVALPSLFTFQPLSPSTLLALITMCSVGFIGQLLMTLGFKYATAGISSLLMLSIIPLTTLSGVFIFNESYNMVMCIGIGFVCVALYIISRWQ